MPSINPETLSEAQVSAALGDELRQVEQEFFRGGKWGDMNTALRYVEGTLPNVIDEDVDEYFTQIVSRDVADAVESTLAEIMPAFTSQRPCSFKPIGQGDEDNADEESEVCNELLMENGFLSITEAVKDALSLRAGIMETRYCMKDEVEYVTVSGVPVRMLPDMQRKIQASGGEVELTKVDGGQEQPDGTTLFGLDDQISVEMKRIHGTRSITNESVPPDEFLLNVDHESMDVSNARLIGRQRRVSRSDLIAEGFDPAVINALPAYSTSNMNNIRQTRRRTYSDPAQSGHRSTDPILVARISYCIDADGDGIAERYRIVAAGDLSTPKILEMEPDTYIPWSIGAAFVHPHEAQGISLYDRLRHVQLLNTKLWRQLLQAGERAIRDRIGVVDTSVNMNDVHETVFGGVIRMDTPGAIAPIARAPFPNDIAETLGGFSARAYQNGGGAPVTKSRADDMPTQAGAYGLQQYMVAIEEVSTQAARVLARTLVKSCFLKIHELLRRYGPDDSVTDWGERDPKTWPERKSVAISMGLTLADRQRQVGLLGSVKQDLMAQQQQGSPLVTPAQLYRVSMDMAQMASLENAEAYYTDPQSPEGQQLMQQAQQQQMQQKQEMEAKEAAMQQMQMQMQQMQQQFMLTLKSMDMQSDQADREQKAVQHKDETDLDYDKLRLDLLEAQAKYGVDDTPPPVSTVQ